MAQEEHILGCNYRRGSGSGSGCDDGRPSKTVKKKKVPQRGLGVAQLEKIRLEEQQKMDSLETLNKVLGMNLIESQSPQSVPVNSPKYRSCYTLTPNINVSYMQAPAPPVPTVITTKNPVQIFNDNRNLGHQTWPRLWNDEYSVAVGEKQNSDHHDFGCEMSQQYEFRSTLALNPTVPKGSSQQLMVNTSPTILQSSVLPRPQAEPPSNQSSCSWSQEAKVGAAKRPYPFTLESHRNVCSTYVGLVSRSDEIFSSINEHGIQVELRTKCIREDPSSLTGLPKWNPSEVTQDKEKLSRDFLTLAPPAFACPPSDIKHRQPLDYSGKQGYKLSEFVSMLTQESVKNEMYKLGPSGSTEQSQSQSQSQSFSFLPSKFRTERSTSCVSNGDGENGETLVDLNLKL